VAEAGAAIYVPQSITLIPERMPFPFIFRLRRTRLQSRR
jgi:hypothetical protein